MLASSPELTFWYSDSSLVCFAIPLVVKIISQLTRGGRPLRYYYAYMRYGRPVPGIPVGSRIGHSNYHCACVLIHVPSARAMARARRRETSYTIMYNRNIVRLFGLLPTPLVNCASFEKVRKFGLKNLYVIGYRKI